ncbi:helicase-related protein [Butyrivibrio sp. WCD3002]|uniref:helicase-related protein n=1 Tax=Butyrivibrio sp. WCD3002 TaxID=1280676 RepID=UPI0004275F20|nr:helicase-related protein [Butyrivibrio sp. WCD3002]
MKKRHRSSFAIKKAKFNTELKDAKSRFPKDAFDEYFKREHITISFAVYSELLDILKNEKIYLDARGENGKNERQEISSATIERFCRDFQNKINAVYLMQIMPEMGQVILDILWESDDTEILEFITSVRKKVISKLIMKYLRESKQIKEIAAFVKSNISEHVVFEQLLKNPNYQRAARRYKKTMDAKRLLFENIETSTPNDYTKLFPLARLMKRKFIIHIGPTNSGKTYQALEDLKKSENGIYLAPLRLLAYEQYEKMNREGVPCSMITGEERILMPGSFHQSSTIEMLDLSEEWDMAVIDEAQMAADRQRGGYWTSAILGARAKTIHICASGDAEDLLIRMIESCGDEYEIQYHERKTPLVMDESATDFNFPSDVTKGDALIVFSRKDVHSVAAELQEHGVKCSIIYGSLPYDVRHREAQKFAEGETDVVVATDAIGMGMNLPIRRIVFLQTIKYDGINERPLTSSEVKQIAGRAGRYGIYDTGYVTSYYDYETIEGLLFSRMIPLRQVMINIPEDFLHKDGKISAILDTWNKIPAEKYYNKGDISEKISIARALESISDNRELIRRFIRIPINQDNRDIFGVYLDYYRLVDDGIAPDIRRTMAEFGAETVDEESKDALLRLEIGSSVFDFLYAFTRAFGDSDDLYRIIDGKRLISEKIFTILDKQKLNLKACAYCGKKLKWSYQYNMCQECFRKRRHLRKHKQ